MVRRGLCLAALVVCLVGGAYGQSGTTAGELNTQGVGLYEAGEYEQAARLFEQTLRIVPGNGIVEQNLANCYMQLADHSVSAGDYSNSIDWINMAIDLQPNNADLYVRAASCNIKVKNLNAAEYNLRAALDLDQENVNAHALLGEVLYSTGNLIGAVAEWEYVLELNPERTDIQPQLDKARREVKVEGAYTVKESNRFLLTYERSELRGEASRVMKMLERIWYSVGRDLKYFPERGVQVPVVLYTPDKFFEATGAGLHVSGLYDGKIRVPIGPQTKDDNTLEMLLTHEYTHVVVRLMTDNNVPFWLNEGLAQFESEEFSIRDRRRIETAIATGKLIPLEQLDGPQIVLKGSQLGLAYAEGFAAVRYLRSKFNSRKLITLLERLGEGYTIQEAMASALRRGYTYDKLQEETFREFVPSE